MENLFEKLPSALLPWYEASKRDLLWRKTREPYRVWLSEIMLQQTRVEAVKGYYARFLEALPTVEALANCDDEQLHKLWEGLGYYSRVRNLKKAAQEIMEKYAGHFPQSYEEVLALPGIGDYTAGAVCSICFDAPTPAVDGNVLRVASRLLDDVTPIDLPVQKKKIRDALQEIYPAQAGDFTQALMELGATLCGPNKKPECETCPCQAFCLGYAHGTAEKLPVKSPKKARRTEEKTVFIFRCDGKYALKKREDTGLLAGLWQFPDVPGKLSLEDAMDAARKLGLQITGVRRQIERSHIFTHIRWDMTGYYFDVKNLTEDLSWMTTEEITQKAALPTAYRQFWDAEIE